MDFDPGIGQYNLTANEHASEFFTLKLNSEGIFKWAIRAGSPSVDQGSSIITDNNGNVFLVGYFSDTVDFNPDTLNTFNLISSGDLDAFVLKISQLITYKEEMNEKEDISIHPNPTTGRFTVNTIQDKSNLLYTITDIYGRIVQKGKFVSNKNPICIDHLPPGFYYLNVLDKTQRSFKIIKK